MIHMEYILWHSLMNLIITLLSKHMGSCNHFNMSMLGEVGILYIRGVKISLVWETYKVLLISALLGRLIGHDGVAKMQ